MDAEDAAAVRRDVSRSSPEGDPLILFNAWDVATAEAIAKASPAVATSSAAVASALGYADGEDVPLDTVTGLVTRMTAAVSSSGINRSGGRIWRHASGRRGVGT